MPTSVHTRRHHPLGIRQSRCRRLEELIWSTRRF
jgi:hypothetical protein